MVEKKEIWKNNSKGQALVLKYDRLGNLNHELVRSGGKVDVSPDERLLNQDRAASSSLDIFANGIMVPVRLVDGAEGAEEIAANPNLKTDEDLHEMFKLHWTKFDEEIASISNSTTLNRLLEIAYEKDATVRQVNSIKAHLVEVDPSSVYEEGMTVQSFSRNGEI